MAYYPEQRFASSWARIQREALLPEEAVGTVRVKQGDRVDILDVVARGLIPARHIVIDATEQLRLRNPDILPELMLVDLRTPVEAGAPIAGQNPERGRRVFAPLDGLVVYVGEGRIIMQQSPEIIEIEAGVRGRVTSVYPNRGVSIQATGAVIQGVWGNGKTALASLSLEPNEGILNMEMDELEQAYRNAIIITRNAITEPTFTVGNVRGFAGIIAPSMDAALIPLALECNFALLLTEGFGSTRMALEIYEMLEQFAGNQATLDAYRPRRWQPRRAEVVINRPPAGATDERQAGVALAIGMRVRVTRQPFQGETGTVIDLPRQRILVENGLRVHCAGVQMQAGETVAIPLANLELAGE